MVVIAYAHDGCSIYGPNLYDALFLRHLVKKNRVYFLTFNRNQVYVPKTVVVSRICEPHVPFLYDKGQVEGLWMYTFALLRSLLIKLRLRQIRPDIILGCLATKYGFYSALSGFRPFVLVIWGSDILIAPKLLFFRFLVKYSLKKADAVIVDSDVQERAAIEMGCSPTKILKFPWFDLETVRTAIPREKVRERLGWSTNPIVVSARSHEPVYGVQHLIESIPYILSKVPETRFLIIGKGQLTQNFRRRTKELEVDAYVKFLGSLPHEDVISYLNAADLNVSMSTSDGSSASLLEAMALGVPSIATKILGNEEWIEDKWNGILIPSVDRQRIAETIVSLLQDVDLRHKLGQRAIKTVNEKADWTKNAQALSRLISELIEDAHKRILYE